ncbi:MAG: Tm-1-like ATP-binding domain-containing protein [Ardenticatenaceae bacterium]|nr:Tm-1-like ATP-binding domain-containing protein [Ardenticatenaceae bacterium]
MIKTVLILAALDTKWQEADFLSKQIQHRGYRTLLLDIGMKGEPGLYADIGREEILLASGEDPQGVAAIVDDRERVMSVVVRGAARILEELYGQARIDGAVCLGGITGTRIGTSIMKSLPFGVPKLAISSTASLGGFASRYIGMSDITLSHSVVEFSGLNDVLRNILAQAAGAICGMVDGAGEAPIAVQQERPFVGMTQWGPCEVCATAVRHQLESKGYQVVGFPANGIGDRAMEEMIERQGLFQAVIDLAPGGVGEELLGFSRAAGSSRLEAAGKRGIPQIVAPSGVNFGTPLKAKYKPKYELRKKYDYDGLRTFIRLSNDELVMVATVMARKLNRARGPVKVVIPLGGWSSVESRQTGFYDGEADRVFVDELKRRLSPNVEVMEIDSDLDTTDFAQAIVDIFERLCISSAVAAVESSTSVRS